MSAIAASSDVTVPSERRLPGDADIWFLIVAELMTFGMFFVAYMGYRLGEIELFNASQLRLDHNLGALNTLFLVTSSLAVVLSLRAARRNRLVEVPRYLAAAIAFGIAFAAVKAFEYSAMFKAGITMTTDNFYMFYFCLTIIHLLHVIGGTVILIVLWTNARKGAYCTHQTKGLETGASYWHMVDLLWIFLFPLLYLLR
jgi:nitric oxide reductase NorE protein